MRSSDGLAFPARIDSNLHKATRFAWRTARNMICSIPGGSALLFPARSLAMDFGPSDAEYAIRVFLHHHRQLDAAGFQSARTIVEAGPGRNIGTALLVWVLNQCRTTKPVRVTLWDVFPNAIVDAESIRRTAEALRASTALARVDEFVPVEQVRASLDAIAIGALRPDIRYQVGPAASLRTGDACNADLVYSHSVIECAWHAAPLWQALIGVSRIGGWHSHRIDLADFGRRDTNYIEMLEWSKPAYWVSMRFIPGAINRWRAAEHLAFATRHGLELRSEAREMRERLPIPRGRLSRRFRSMSDAELRTTALDLVAVRSR